MAQIPEPSDLSARGFEGGSSDSPKAKNKKSVKFEDKKGKQKNKLVGRQSSRGGSLGGHLEDELLNNPYEPFREIPNYKIDDDDMFDKHRNKTMN